MTFGSDGCGDIDPMHQGSAKKITELVRVVWQNELRCDHL
jgi:hypothetical protein